MTIRETNNSVSADIDAACVRLERMRHQGFFAQPRNLSNIWCRLTDEGHLVDLAILGVALHRLWGEGEFSRTLLVDGLLHYVNTTNAGHWRSIDVAAAGATRMMQRASNPPVGLGP